MIFYDQSGFSWYDPDKTDFFTINPVFPDIIRKKLIFYDQSGYSRHNPDSCILFDISWIIYLRLLKGPKRLRVRWNAFGVSARVWPARQMFDIWPPGAIIAKLKDPKMDYVFWRLSGLSEKNQCIRFLLIFWVIRFFSFPGYV